MRLENEFNALISKINQKLVNYSEKEMVVSNELEHDILDCYEKVKKFTVWTVIAFAILVVIMGAIYDLLSIINTKWIMWIVGSVGVLIFLVIFGIQIFYKVKLRKLNKQKAKEDSSKNDVKNDIISLNDQISILVVSVITLNEHFYELSSIEDKEQLKEVWDKYVKIVTSNILHKYNYHPTYTEFEEYYHNYEHFLRDLNEE